LFLLAALLNPLGLDIIQAAFFTSEALSRNIWLPLASIAIVILVTMVGLEWLFRTLALRRRARGTSNV
jgi:formate hydrogenlyase subunit 3/multisubunit Na+/H+ antiporter MnhD subunit